MPTFTMSQDELRRKELERHEKAETYVNIRVKTNDTSHLQVSGLPVHGKNEIPSLK